MSVPFLVEGRLDSLVQVTSNATGARRQPHPSQPHYALRAWFIVSQLPDKPGLDTSFSSVENLVAIPAVYPSGRASKRSPR
ncbi:hypothetical protein F01_80006 [Burkholderia cenocepacia]|nr:hypothetical protein F01_80006 [Burkholderia cenocepacia]